jgi:hypothetical protein
MPENDIATQKYFIAAYDKFKEEALAPEARYKNLGSLDSLKNEVFIFFQEGKGDTVEYFWKRIEEEKLELKRANKLNRILKRKKIINQEEYDFITDTVVPMKQLGAVSEEEFVDLTNMLNRYQFRQR